MSFITCCFRKSQTPSVTDPLLPPPPKYSCLTSRVKKVCLGILGAATAGVAGIAGIVTYRCIRDFKQLDSFDRFACSTVLAGEGLLLLLAASCTAICCRRLKQKHQELVDSHPSGKNYQGTMINSINYLLEQELKVEINYFTNGPILNSLQDLEFLRIFQNWIKLKGYASVEEGIQKLLQYMTTKKGLCGGYSMKLWSLMPTHYNSTCEELNKHLNFEDIYLFQFWGMIVHDFRYANWEVFNTIIKYKEMPKEGLTKEWRVQYINVSILFIKLFKRITFLDKGLCYVSNICEIPSTSQEFENNFRKALHDFSMQAKSGTPLSIEPFSEFESYLNKKTVVVGKIYLAKKETNSKKAEEKECKEKKELKEKDEEANVAAHSIFFQFSHRLRFHDSGSLLSGFFEFSNERQFFDALFKHIQKDYNGGIMDITLLALPLKEDKS